MKEKKPRGFSGMLLVTLRASLLGNLLPSKWVIRDGDGVIWAGEGVIRTGQNF